MIQNIDLADCKTIDLFCGIGGLTHGFVKEGFNVVAGYDIDETCRYAFESNNESVFIAKDVAIVTGSELLEKFGNAKVKILVGCAPCQPFSSYTFKEKNKNYEKWSLLYHFSRLIKEVMPDIISMENVAQIINFKKEPVLKDFIDELKKLDYQVSYEVVKCAEYGIPQKRRRIVLLASKYGKIDLIEKTHSSANFVTVRDIIYNLPKIQDGESYENDPLHFSRKLSPLNKIRITNTPYGGSWKDWASELVLTCHKKESGKSYSSVYGRMKWEEPAPTVTTHCIGYGNGRFGHPEQDRAISLREAALFQTFPISYKFFDEKEKVSNNRIAKQLGNAVPVKLGEVIAKSIISHLKSVFHENN